MKKKPDLVAEFLRRRGKVYPDKMPLSEEQASRRFICTKLTPGGCEIAGKDCARRHVNAASRWRNGAAFFDASLYNTPYERNDQTCATCDTGKKRAELIGIQTKHRRKRERPKHGPALSKALKTTPAEAVQQSPNGKITTQHLRIKYRWTENTVKKWLLYYEGKGEIQRIGRKGLFIQYRVVYAY